MVSYVGRTVPLDGQLRWKLDRTNRYVNLVDELDAQGSSTERSVGWLGQLDGEASWIDSGVRGKVVLDG